jgi:tetratricopeptide (TPR) repeat protein
VFHFECVDELRDHGTCPQACPECREPIPEFTAVELITRCIKLCPDHLQRDRFTVARELLLQSEDAAFYADLGDVLLGEGDLPGAGAHFTAALFIEPTNGSWLRKRGVCESKSLQNSGHLAAAIAVLEAVLAMDPSDVEIQYKLANMRNMNTMQWSLDCCIGFTVLAGTTLLITSTDTIVAKVVSAMLIYIGGASVEGWAKLGQRVLILIASVVGYSLRFIYELAIRPICWIFGVRPELGYNLCERVTHFFV